MKSIKMALGAIALTGLIVISAIAIYGIEVGEPQNHESDSKNIKEVIQVAEWYTLECFPGGVSDICVIISQHHNSSDPTYGYDLYIDGEFHSKGVSRKTIFVNDDWYAGFLFDEWDTASYENGLHELQIYGENGELVDSILVLVQN